MKFFNSVTGQIEDDGKDIKVPDSINIPMGRVAYPDGSQDLKLPLDGIVGQKNFERQSGQDTSLDMQANPEKYPFFSMDFLNQSGVKPVSMSNPSDTQSAPAPEMNPLVKKHIENIIRKTASSQNPVQNPLDIVQSADAHSSNPGAKPSFMDAYSDEKYNDVKSQADDKQTGLGLAQILAGVGDAIAGRSSSQTAQNFDGIRKNLTDNMTGEFQRQKKNAIENYSTNRTIEQNEITDDQRKRDLDINSEESRMAQALALKMGVNPEVAKKLTAAKFKETSPVMEKMYAVEQARLARQDAKADRNLQRDQMQAQKKEEKGRLSESQLKEVQDFDDTINKAQSALTQLGDKSNYTGSLDGRIPDMLVGSDQVAFRAAVGRMTDSYRKLITGAGASNQELARLESRLPQPTDTFSDFQAKAKSLIEETKRAKESHLKNLAYNGKNVEPFQSSDFLKSSFPRQVSKGGKIATVSNAEELKEAQSEGWK